MKGFEDFVRKFGAHGLGYFQMKEDGLKGPLVKFFTEEDIALIIKTNSLCDRRRTQGKRLLHRDKGK
jgi:aspartyl-tRNA synthetase